MLTRISLNGADNVGKSTMIDYMPMNDVEIRSSVSEYDDLLNDLKKKNTLKEWFFTKSTHEEFINVTMRATNKRADVRPKNNTKFLIYDRGGLMCEAVCITIIACKEKCDLIQAATIYASIIDKYGIYVPREDIRILLKHGHCLEDSLQISLNRECEHDQLYDEYQMLLQKQLLIQELNNQYTDIINVTDMSVVQVQNQIRTIIRNYCLSSFIKIDRRHFNPMFEHVNMIIAFDGMSQSGENTLAESICQKLESIGVAYQRLQIQDFIELASNTLGLDAYQFSEQKQANQLVKQLDHYINRHYWIAVVTMESCHRFGCIQSLKKILGDLLQIFNVDMMKSSDESINNIYAMIEQKREKINLFPHQFLFNAGSVLIKKSTCEVCLIHHLDGKDEWFLPKGQKNIDEPLSATAIRITLEETGYHCSLMSLLIETSATSFTTTSRPFIISPYQIEATPSNQVIIFWYVTQMDEQCPKEIVKKNTEATLLSFDEVNRSLLHDDEKEVVRKAFKLFVK